jgi:hypothetical protein
MLGLDPSIHTARAIDQNGIFESVSAGLDPRVKPEDDPVSEGGFIANRLQGPWKTSALVAEVWSRGEHSGRKRAGNGLADIGQREGF